jgi:hypothetical protein
VLAEAYHWHLDDILWRLTLPQALRMLDARAERVDRQNSEQTERSENPEGLTNAELARKHAEAKDDETVLPFDDIRRTIGF